MGDYEKLGVFYLGREVEEESGSPTGPPLLYDSKDLTTHGVIIGMTGSGKTGLGIGLLEEAAMDGIPVIAIDPKGDLGNLLLTFPELAPEDFRPWTTPGAASRAGLSPEEFSVREAEQWRKGLGEWGQDGERIRRLREEAEFAIYTPGSSAGRRISILRSLEAPTAELREDADAFRDRISGTVSGILSLIGIDADPLLSREHILLSTLLEERWREGRGMELAELIQGIQSPPFTRVGVMELEAFHPAKDRFALAMRLNALLASPGFRAWTEGEPLDIASLLHTPEGKPRVSIFSIAHLGDAERMFFVTMLLQEVLSWMRGQSGTSSLRALLYMDEVFGFFPPVAEPPSKKPMLSLLKQARAFGVGVVLSTQNPVDLDYKGLGNTGSWFIGRLQTERDRKRVLDALEGAMAGAAERRGELEAQIAGLGKRTFLLYNVHDSAPVRFGTRWAMSYLAGPLTPAQIRILEGGAEGAATSGDATGAKGAEAPELRGHSGQNGHISQSGAGTGGGTQGDPSLPDHAFVPPVLPPAIRQHFLSFGIDGVPGGAGRRGGADRYLPGLFTAAEVRYTSTRDGVDEARALRLFSPLDGEGTIPFDPALLAEVEIEPDDLDAEPGVRLPFAELPGEAMQPRSWTAWEKEIVRWIRDNRPLTLWEAPSLKQVSRPDESEGEFRVRLRELQRELRDQEAERIRARFDSRFRTLQERERRALQQVERREAMNQQRMMDAGIRIAGDLLGGFLGRKKVSGAAAGRGIRSAGRVLQGRTEVTHAEETVEAVRAEIAALEGEFQRELEKIEERHGEVELREKAVRAPLNAIRLRFRTLLWVPEG